MSLFAMLGKKHMEIASKWVGSAVTFGGAAGVGALYFTDWRVVLQYLPYYNGKFDQQD